jgi:hypothetical protein
VRHRHDISANVVDIRARTAASEFLTRSVGVIVRSSQQCRMQRPNYDSNSTPAWTNSAAIRPWHCACIRCTFARAAIFELAPILFSTAFQMRSTIPSASAFCVVKRSPADRMSGTRFERCLFANDSLWVFVSPQSEEHRLTQLVVVRPLGKFNLSDEYGFDPLATFHDRRCDPLAPTPSRFLRQVDKEAARTFEFLQVRVDARKKFLGKAAMKLFYGTGDEEWQRHPGKRPRLLLWCRSTLNDNACARR